MDREEPDGADGVEAVCEWLATEAGLCEEEMHEAAEELRFEYAARLRDEIKDLKRGAVEAR